MNEQDVATPGAGPTVVGGRYELGALLGTGASAQVRRAADRVSGREVAVKLFHAGASAHDRRRQQREMQALGNLNHPGLVALHGGGVEAGRPFLVTDLVEGPTLAECITAGPLDPEQVCRIGAHLADALAAVHRGGFVHRDLKPANVLIGPDGRPRLADFGIARALDGTAVTGTGFVVGTAAYLAPEQVRGERVGPEADVYALGLVLLEALTARREYPGALVESATARLHRPPGVPDTLPDALRTALHAMTALEPAARPTAAEVTTLLGPGATRRRGGRGVHRRGRTPRGAAPRAAGLAAALAVAAAITAVAVPASAPRLVPVPEPRSDVRSDLSVAGLSGRDAPVAERPVADRPVSDLPVSDLPVSDLPGGDVPGGAAAPWAAITAVAPVDRVAAALGAGADAARRKAATAADLLAATVPSHRARAVPRSVAPAAAPADARPSRSADDSREDSSDDPKKRSTHSSKHSSDDED